MFKIEGETCTGCGGCQELCPEVAIASVNGLMRILEEKCTGCKICLKVCPVRAITEE